MKEFYLYGLMKKEEGVCVLPDFGSAGGHTEGLFEEASFREEGKKSHGLIFFSLIPHFLTRTHIYCRINKSY